MQTRQLGGSDLRVPVLSLGVGTFGGGPDWPYGNTDLAQARELVAACLDAGVTMFDSADVYGAGQSQEILGAALAGRRDEALLSVKAGLPIGPGPADQGTGRAHLTAACEAALRRLRTDWIDVFTLHLFDATTPIEETLDALASLISSGKVRHVGVSNYAAWQLMKSLSVADCLDLPRFVSQQVYYSLVGRDFELELMAVGLDQGLGTLVWSPLSGGWLSGSVARDRPPAAGSRLDRLGAGGPPVCAERLYDVLDVLAEIAAACDRSIPQVALNWLLGRPTVASLIVGADDEAQLRENLDATGWELAADQIERLDAASTTMPPYPAYMYHRDPGFSDLAPPPVPRTLS